MRTIKPIIGLILALFLFSLSASAQNMDLKNIRGLKVEKLDGNELTLKFNTSIDNTSGTSFGVKIKKGKIYKNGEYLGTFRLIDKIKIKEPGVQNVEVRVLVIMENKPNLLKEGLSMLTGNHPEVHVTGVFKATKFIFSKKYPFEIKEKVSMKSFMGR
ncbi:MAG: hypothetical protein ACK4ND_18190 [Cytophagaceae bacterium]